MSSTNDSPPWYRSVVGWMFSGLGSTIGVVLLAVGYHETRITTLEANENASEKVAVRVEAQLDRLNTNLTELRRDVDRALSERKP